MSLREVVQLSRHCRALADVSSFGNEFFEVMKRRDTLYLRLDAWDARAFIEWAFNRMSDEDMDARICDRAPGHDPGDEDPRGAVLC